MTTTEQNEREPSEAELFIIHATGNARNRTDERAAVREAAEALNRAGRDAYTAMVDSIAETERKRGETTAEA